MMSKSLFNLDKFMNSNNNKNSVILTISIILFIFAVTIYSKAEHMQKFMDYACNVANKGIESVDTNKENFQDPFSGGGMTRDEKEFLASVYEKADSVFE